MLTSAVFCAQIDLSQNTLCGLDEYGTGTYTAEGITAIADAMGVSHSLNSIDVGYNDIDQAAALELLAAMKEKAMVSIGMARCNLGVKGAKRVAEMAVVSQSLTQVHARFYSHAWSVPLSSVLVCMLADRSL